MKMKAGIVNGLVVLIGFGGGACCPDKTGAGTTAGIAVVSVTPWDRFKQDLQPRFELTEAQALQQGLRDTSQLENTVNDVFRARVGLQLAPSSQLPATKPTTNPAGVGDTPAAPTTAPSVITPGNLAVDPFLQYDAATALYTHVKLLNRYVRDAAIPDGYLPYVARVQVSVTPSQRFADFDTFANLAFFSDGVSVPPKGLIEIALPEKQRVEMLWQKYTSGITDSAVQATQRSLQKEIANALDDYASALAADDRNAAASAAVLARSKVQLVEFPSSMDATVRLSLARIKARAFLKQAQIHLNDGEPKAAQRFIDSALMFAEPMANRRDHEKLTKEVNELVEKIRIESHKTPTPIVVPLLVSDQVESAIESRRLEQMRQYVLSLAAAYAGVSGNVDLEKIDQAITQAHGRSFNTLLNVSRVADNMIRVRIGARRNGATKDGAATFQAMAQTHHITVLLLVPKPSVEVPTVPVFAACRADVMDPAGKRVVGSEGTTGDELKDWGSRIPEFEKLVANSAGEGKPDAWLKVATAVASNDAAAFYVAVSPKAATEDSSWRAVANRLWLELQVSNLLNDIRTTRFEVPYFTPTPSGLPPTSVNAYVLDDGKSAVASIAGVADVEPGEVSAVWHFTVDTAKTPSNTAGKLEQTLSNTSVAIQGKQLLIGFPSLMAMKKTQAGEGITSKHVVVTMRAEPEKEYKAEQILFAAASASDPTVQLEAQATTVTLGKPGDSREYQFAIRTADGFAAPTKPKEGYVLTASGYATHIAKDGDPSGALEPIAGTFSYAVKKDGIITLVVDDPRASGKLTISVQSPKGVQPVSPLVVEFAPQAP